MTGVPRAETYKSTCSIKPLVSYVVRHTSVIWIAFTFMAVWIMPLTHMLNTPRNRTLFFEAPFNLGKLLVIPVCMLMAIRAFDYLTKDRATTFFHSLPYSRTTLFIVNALTGFALIVIPMFLVSVWAFIVSIVQGTGLAGYIFSLFGILCCECFYVYAFTILMVMLFSNKGSLFPMTAILFCYTEIMTFISDIVLFNLLDINRIVNNPSDTLMLLSPLRVCLTTKLSYANSYNYSFKGCETVLPAQLICGALILVLAYVLYRKRKSERSGEVVAFKSCRYIFKWGFSLSLAVFMTLLFGVTTVYNTENLTLKSVVICATFIVFSLILYLIAEMMVSKKFNIFKKVRLELLAVFAVTLILSVLAATDVFGIKNYMPDYEDINYLSVNIEDEYDEKTQALQMIRIDINSDPSDIAIKKAFYDLNKRIINDKPEEDISDKVIEFIYYDNDRNISGRSYKIPSSYLDPLSFYIEARKEEKTVFLYKSNDNEMDLFIHFPSYFLRRFINYVDA